MSTELKKVTKITQVIQRDDGSEVKIVAEAFFGAGLHQSIDVYVHKRESANHDWICAAIGPTPTGGQCQLKTMTNMADLLCCKRFLQGNC